MVCSTCKKQIEWCECQKNNEIVKNWPRHTWLQERLKKVRLAEMNGKQDGYTFVDACLFLGMACLVILGIVTLAYVGKQAIENLQSVGRCVQALLECTHI